jgi:4-hydroxymandelate oxidase
VTYGYIAGGAGDELTVAENVAAWRRFRLRPHMLRDVSSISTATTVLGTPVAGPILVAPTAMHGLVCEQRELATARAAQRCGTVHVLSQAVTTSLEDVAATDPGAPRWMQVAVQRDRGITRDVCARAGAHGYRAIVVTVDSPVLMRRTRFEQASFNVPAGMGLPNLVPAAGVTPDLYEVVLGFDPTLTFDDLPLLAEWSGGLPVGVKGIVRGDDAARCVDAGAAAILVSNHGGRQVDTCVSTASVLAEVVEAVDGRAEVYVDGGIRRGHDVLKALALGARAVLVGRSVVWGLALGGEDGVVEVLTMLRDELETTLGLCGLTSVHDVPADLLTTLA